MTIKTTYNIGDDVWVSGVGSSTKLTKGTVVKSFVVDYDGISQDVQYVIAIPTEVEYLLEIRTWQTISQDAKGPVGSLRDLKNLSATNKVVSRVGYIYAADSHYTDFDDPHPDIIHAALEKSKDLVTHSPLVLKENKPKRRNFPRKKKQQ